MSVANGESRCSYGGSVKKNAGAFFSFILLNAGEKFISLLLAFLLFKFIFKADIGAGPLRVKIIQYRDASHAINQFLSRRLRAVKTIAFFLLFCLIFLKGAVSKALFSKIYGIRW